MRISRIIYINNRQISSCNFCAIWEGQRTSFICILPLSSWFSITVIAMLARKRWRFFGTKFRNCLWFILGLGNRTFHSGALVMTMAWFQVKTGYKVAKHVMKSLIVQSLSFQLFLGLFRYFVGTLNSIKWRNNVTVTSCYVYPGRLTMKK